MHGAARVLIVGNADEGGEALHQALHSSGFETISGNISESATELSGSRRPDVVILNMNSPEGRKNPNALYQFARTLKESSLSSRMRILLVGQDNVTPSSVPTEIDDLLLGPARPGQICHRLKHLVRLNTMHEELVRRLSIAEKYGVDAPRMVMPPRRLDNVQVLYLGEMTGITHVEDALSKQATVVGALSQGTAIDYMARLAFDALVIDCGKDPAPYIPFISSLRRNSKFFNMPVILMGDDSVAPSMEEAYQAGATDVLVKPTQTDELNVRTMSLIRENRFRDALREVYSSARHFATNDALTGLYARGFMYEHLTNLINDTNRTSQTFSVTAFELMNLGELNKELGHARGDRLIRQVGEIVSLLVRGEDLAARYSGSRFVVVHPDTTAEHALYALDRIKGVVKHTEFVIPDHNAVVYADIRCNVTEYQEGDSAETLMERLWAQ